jgi:hypothetical protein
LHDAAAAQLDESLSAGIDSGVRSGVQVKVEVNREDNHGPQPEGNEECGPLPAFRGASMRTPSNRRLSDFANAPG